jgi:hypothetical protein
MTLSALANYIGGKLYVSAASPANENKAGYEALTWTEVGQIVSHGALGNTSNDIAQATLGGVTLHANGSKDLGEIAITCVDAPADAGQVIIMAANNTNTMHSFKVVDPSTKHQYYQGVVANAQQAERTDTAYAGLSFVVRGHASSLLLNQAAPS